MVRAYAHKKERMRLTRVEGLTLPKTWHQPITKELIGKKVGIVFAHRELRAAALQTVQYGLSLNVVTKRTVQ